MTPFINAVTEVLAFSTLLTHIVLLGLVVLFVTRRNAQSVQLLNWIREHVLMLCFFIVLGTVVSSLFYSVIAGFEPCQLCWWQRIFLFPQLILFGLALYKKDRNVLPYALWLSIMGGAVALYHTYIQFGGLQFLPCDASGASCTQRFFMEFGYITIPTMSLTVFALLIALLLIERKR